MKCCKVCGVDKPLSEFYRNSKSAGGRWPTCISCEKVKRRATYAACASLRARALARVNAWVGKNRWRRRAANTRYQSKPANKTRRLAGARRRYWADIERSRMAVREKAAARRGAFVEHVDIEEVIRRYGCVCYLCRTEVTDVTKAHLEHVIPVSKGGEHSYANVRLAHGKCNLLKGARVDFNILRMCHGIEVIEF